MGNDYNNYQNKRQGIKPKQPNKVRRIQSRDFRISLTGKHVFGAYFNMARTNFVKTINYVLPIAGVRGNYSENQINKMLQALFLIHSNRSAELTQDSNNGKGSSRSLPNNRHGYNACSSSISPYLVQ